MSGESSTSLAWQFCERMKQPEGFKEGDDDSWKSRAICTICKSLLSLGSKQPQFQTTSNLLNHLRKRHHDDIAKAEKDKELTKIMIRTEYGRSLSHISTSLDLSMRCLRRGLLRLTLLFS
jgi:hypothetical protein